MNLLKRFSVLSALVLITAAGCKPPAEPVVPQPENTQTALDVYVNTPDDVYAYETVQTIPGDGYSTHIIRMTSQRWLTTSEVEDPLWWHWMTVVVPETVQRNTGLLVIGGGSRNSDQPDGADPLLVQSALLTQSVTAYLHNVPNQPMRFVGDDYGPRVEDELIAYGWRQYLEGGAQDQDLRWLARLPMTKAAVRALDTVTSFCDTACGQSVDRFVVAGGSKRGWTTWTTAAVDDRVVAIAPIVIDMLNVVPSFQHHWQVYGFWAPAVGDYEHEGIMNWQATPEYSRLIENVEPYSFRHRLDLPKFLINATGDQFFLPDSWQFYWDNLIGEKYLRYVANADHSLSDTDALESFVAFYHSVVTDTPRPTFEWEAVDGTLQITTHPDHPPSGITIWQASNPEARDFRVDTIGKTWQSQPVEPSTDGRYILQVETPTEGWTAFYAELKFPGGTEVPYTFTTGVVVVPDTYPYPPFEAESPAP